MATPFDLPNREETKQFMDDSERLLGDMTDLMERAERAGIDMTAQKQRREQLLGKIRRFKGAFFPNE